MDRRAFLLGGRGPHGIWGGPSGIISAEPRPPSTRSLKGAKPIDLPTGALGCLRVPGPVA
jgi:hypothetical protein